MIILAKSGNHGGNALRYAMEKEKAKVIKLNFLPEHITPIAIWERMKLHCMLHEAKHTHGRPIQDHMVSLVVSPNPKEVEGWTDRDWEELTTEVMHEIDSVDICDLPKCKNCKPTNFSNSMSVAAQHNDSKSGVVHLHIDLCRLDMDGNTNDLHQIHLRCMRAAENINRRHGWEQPTKIRNERKQKMEDDCLEILRKMKRFDLDMYFAALRQKGYAVALRSDKQGKLHGYTLGIGATVIKASELGTGRKLMVSKLEDTWRYLHKEDFKVSRTSLDQDSPKQNNFQPGSEQPAIPTSIPRPTTLLDIGVAGIIWRCELPNSVKDMLFNEAQLPSNTLWSTIEDVAHTAILLFCGYVDAATAISESCGGGGGGSDTKGWGRDKDEDDFDFARRCLDQACKMHTRSRGRHR